MTTLDTRSTRRVGQTAAVVGGFAMVISRLGSLNPSDRLRGGGVASVPASHRERATI